MKHGYRHVQGVRVCELGGCWKRWPCEDHGTRVAWNPEVVGERPRPIHVGAMDSPGQDLAYMAALIYHKVSFGTAKDKKCMSCGYHKCGDTCPLQQPIFPRIALKQP